MHIKKNYPYYFIFYFISFPFIEDICLLCYWDINCMKKNLLHQVIFILYF